MKKLEEVLQNRGDNYLFPFFWQHGEDEKTLREYMGAIDGCGISSVCLECRPHPDFLGPGWWHDLDILIDEAKKRGMKIWILDDAHFPTGYANGAMADEPDQNWKQFLCVKMIDVRGPEREVSIDLQEALQPVPSLTPDYSDYMGVKYPKREFHDTRVISVMRARARGEGVEEETLQNVTRFIRDGKLLTDVPAGAWRYFIIYKTRNGGGNSGYINLISKPSVGVLLKTVYEPHYERYKDEFGKTIEGFFSDEPQLGNVSGFDDDNRIGKLMPLPWSDELEWELISRWHLEFGDKLVWLFAEDMTGDRGTSARYDYMDALTGKVQEDFSYQIGDWCASHGVRYIGHIIEDNGEHARLGQSVGHYFRGLAGQHMAGIDDIGNQVQVGGADANRKASFGGTGNYDLDADFFHFALGKLASSHASLDKRKQGDSMCEIFGAYGWGENTREMKYLADHFLVRGINHFVPHAFSPKAFPDPDCPPHFYAHGLNPLYEGFGQLCRYMNRCCHLMSGGRAEVPVAVLYHGEAEWTSYKKGMIMSRVPARILSESQVDFEFVWQDALLNKDGRFDTHVGHELVINGQHYGVLIVPYSYYMTAELATFLHDAADKGLPVVFYGGYPEKLFEYGADDQCISCDEDCENCTEEEEKASELSENTEGLKELLKNLKEKTISAKDLRFNNTDVTLRHPFKDLRYRHYILDDGEMYFFVNESTFLTFDDSIRVEASGIPVFYDALQNRLYKADTESGAFRLKLRPFESVFLCFVKPGAEILKAELQDRPGEDILSVPVPGPWKVSLKDALHKEEGYGKEKVTFELHSAAIENPDFSGFICYTAAFDPKSLGIPALSGKARLILKTEEAHETLRAFVNGQDAGFRICPPYEFDITDFVKGSSSTLVLECATTLERAVSALNRQNGGDPMAAYFGTHVLMPTGIIGDVTLNVRVTEE